MIISLDAFKEYVNIPLSFHKVGPSQILATSPTFSIPISGIVEFLPIFDPTDQPLIIDSRTLLIPRSERYKDGGLSKVYHRGSCCFIVKDKNQVLIPKRSEIKELYPGTSDISVAEHSRLNESYFETIIRGFQEEQQFTPNQRNLFFMFKITLPLINAIAEFYVYFLDKDDHPNFSDEIESQRWVPFSSLKAEEDSFRPDLLPGLLGFIENYEQFKKQNLLTC